MVAGSGVLSAWDSATAVPVPSWAVEGPLAPVIPGQPFDVTAKVTLPSGYYQDSTSDFLTFEPLAPGRVLSRSSSAPGLRDGKPSFTGVFTLRRTIVLPDQTPAGTLRLAGRPAGKSVRSTESACFRKRLKSVFLSLWDPGPPAGLLPPAAQGLSFWGALAGAFLGGILLNLMPCVFPVLALKALNLAAASGRSLRSRRKDAAIFAAGGLAALVGIGCVTALVLLAGQRLEWGFSFQQPAFIWGLLLVFWGFALQLWGVWTWNGSPFSFSQPLRFGVDKIVCPAEFSWS